jgi:neutral ceramidase
MIVVRAASLVAVAVGFLVLSRGPQVIAGQPPAAPAFGPFRAGAAQVDITPPPGLATGGYGPAGAITRGQLTRLWARAIYIEAADRSALLLVSVESFAVPQVFRTAIRDAVRARAARDLPLASVIVAATHTHHGPGNYLSAAIYNKNGSAVGDYVGPLRKFLVTQITEAAVRAIASSLTNGPATLMIGRAPMGVDLARNRSPETFLLNHDAAAIMESLDTVPLPSDAAGCARAQHPHEQDGGWDLPGCPRLRAVDRTVTVIDISSGSRRIASMVFAGVHPTVLPTDTPLYSSDFAGIAMRLLEREAGASFVSAFFNGSEGDITTRRVDRDLRDVWHHASLFAEAVRAAQRAMTPLAGPARIESRMHVAAWGEESLDDAAVRLAPLPRGGAAAIGGGEGDRTVFYALGWREHAIALRADRDHGTKLNPLKSNLLPLPDLTDLIGTTPDFPRALPLGYVRIGNVEIMTAPTEVSTASAAMMRGAIKAPQALLISLANEYASYTASVDEYPAQDYMAASTLWGPYEAAFFASVMGQLKGNQISPDAAFVDEPGGEHHKLRPFDVGARRTSIDEDLTAILRSKDHAPVRDLPFIVWYECRQVNAYDHGIQRHVAIVDETGTVVGDDADGRLIVLLTEQPIKGVSRWAALWADRLLDDSKPGRVRFSVTRSNGLQQPQPLYTSDAFDNLIARGQQHGSGDDACSAK